MRNIPAVTRTFPQQHAAMAAQFRSMNAAAMLAGMLALQHGRNTVAVAHFDRAIQFANKARAASALAVMAGRLAA